MGVGFDTPHTPSLLDDPVRLVLSIIPAALWIVDRDLRITTAFGSGLDSLSLHPELDSLVGLDAFEYFGTGDPGFYAIANHVRALAGESVVCEARLRGRIAEVRLEPLRREGEIVGVIGFGLDVTDRRELEARLERAQRLESYGALAGGIAHDFNNVLTAISGYTTLARREVEPGGAAHNHLDHVLEAANHGAEMTTRLMAFARTSEPEPRELDVNEIVTDVGGMLRRLIGARIELVTDLDPELPAISADANQLRRLLVNLAVNARDAMPAGGTLTICTTHEAGVVGIHVRDTGAGIPEELRERVFEPFFTTKPEGKGTGLGLATVHGIVVQAGGRIEVGSAPGGGTSFAIALPSLAA